LLSGFSDYTYRKGKEIAIYQTTKRIERGSYSSLWDLGSNQIPGFMFLWPILLGIFGGIIAAAMAFSDHKKSWWLLLLVGLIISVIRLVIGYGIHGVYQNFLAGERN
jgi:hypothetical protein